MTQEHPITPPPELIAKWASQAVEAANCNADVTVSIATQAARWGADMELEACCEWLSHDCDLYRSTLPKRLRAARRPKPPSLKEQALGALEKADGSDYPVVATILTADQHALIRRALEALPS